MSGAQIALTGGFYKAASLTAGAQRCLNLYAETNEKGAPYPYTYYYTPGLRELAQADGGEWRCLYQSSVGGLYGVCGSNVYKIDGAWHLTLLGQIATVTGQVAMADNRLCIVVVDGTSAGYVIDPFTNSFQTINTVNFYGANRVRYVDTFFVFDRPDTNQFYISLSEVTPAMLTGGEVIDGTIVGGTGYASGTHLGVMLSGGTGTDVTAEVTVTAGVVTAVFITVGGESYRVGDVLTATAAQLGGAAATGSITAGSGYTNATYTGVALQGGTGSGAIASVTVAGGVVTAVSITTAGSGYTVGDVLDAPASALGGVGSGFAWTIATVTSTGSGFTYTVTEVGSSAFDPTDIAAKTGASDSIVTLEVLHRDVWLFGSRFASEIWYNAGGADFAFARMPGVYVEHGCAALNSPARTDLTMFWLGKDNQGNAIAFAGMNYTAIRISTFAIEAEWSRYTRINDAIGFCYQKRGHTFYVLIFPSADKTWVYDLAEKVWHEWAWTDENSNEHRVRANCCAFFLGEVIVGDWENGKLYALESETYTDDGSPILRKRGFPHVVADGNRAQHIQFIARMAAGLAPGLTTDQSPGVSLRYSDDGGGSWGNPVIMPVGSTGQYGFTPTWWQLGVARDRVYELFWDFPYETALQGAWLKAQALAT